MRNLSHFFMAFLSFKSVIISGSVQPVAKCRTLIEVLVPSPPSPPHTPRGNGWTEPSSIVDVFNKYYEIDIGFLQVSQVFYRTSGADFVTLNKQDAVKREGGVNPSSTMANYVKNVSNHEHLSVT